MTDPVAEPQIAATPSVRHEGSVAVLSLGSGEGRFNSESVAALQTCLDEIISSEAIAMVTTAESKIWSNGMDLDWFRAHPDQAGEALRQAEVLFGRLLTFPIPTVAAIGGHAFAGGVFLALAHDLRIMRADRGYFCLNEVAMGVVFTRGMFAQLTATMTKPTAHRAIVLGHRFTAAEAVQAGLIAEAVPQEELLGRALAIAEALGPRERTVLAEVKRHIYADAFATLGAAPPEPSMLRALGVVIP